MRDTGEGRRFILGNVKDMDNIIVDRSGILKEGIFFELEVLEYDEVWAEQHSKHAKQDVVSLRKPKNDDLFVREGTSYVRAIVMETGVSEEAHDCSLDKGHMTACYWQDIQLELSGGPHFSDLIVGDLDANVTLVVPERMAMRLKASPFRGYRLVKIENVDYFRGNGLTAKTPGFALHELQFRGRKCIRGMSIVGAPNACPHCGFSPAICPECGQRFIFCPKCEKDPWVARIGHKGAGDKRLITAGYDQWQPMIIDVNRWDGADFVFVSLDRGMYSQVITKRVLDWLLSIHAAPFIARPVLARLDGATPDQLRMLDEVCPKQSKPESKKSPK